MGGDHSGQDAQKQNIAAQTALANKQDARAQKLFDIGLPGVQTAENYYQNLASGDSKAIFKAIAPATEQIAGQTKQAKDQITQNLPRGGVQTLALAQADIAKAGQIGNLATQAYTSAFPALEGIGSGAIGLSTNQIATAVQALSGAGNVASSLAQNQAEGKASTMGFVSSLAGAGAELGGAFA